MGCVLGTAGIQHEERIYLGLLPVESEAAILWKILLGVDRVSVLSICILSIQCCFLIFSCQQVGLLGLQTLLVKPACTLDSVYGDLDS